MKELTIEEKAKRYDEAFKEASVAYKDEDRHLKATLERIFPELKESEDERIRKCLIAIITDFDSLYLQENYFLSREETLAWLEKQGEHARFREAIQIGDHVTKNEDGELVNLSQLKRVAKPSEQKPADKVEPKFHEGDWLCENEPNNYARFIQILETVNVQSKERYRISRDIHNDEDIVEFGFVEKYYHKFDIQDAKDGDVLYAKGNYFKEYLFMFSSVTEDNVISTHFGYDVFHRTFDKKLTRFGREEDFVSVIPATKEQRDLLFKKMTDAGYTFDFEKKELKKIEQKPAELPKCEDYGIDGLYNAIRILEETLGKVDGYQTDDGILEHKCAISAVKNLYEQKPAWSEEDEAILNKLLAIVALYYGYCGNVLDKQSCTSFLKSLKDRVQPKSINDWSEEDERYTNIVVSALSSPYLERLYHFNSVKSNDIINWFESLKDRYTWKPSDEQMNILKQWLKDNQYKGDARYCYPIFESLYQELKKLKG